MVSNGCHQPRSVVTAAGPVAVRAPRVNDRRIDEATGERKRFFSRILPPWCRKSPTVCEVLPPLSLHGLSCGDFVPALEQFLGGAAGLSAATVTRPTKQWQDDHAAFQDRDLSDRDYVYVWADGVHPKVRLGQARSCVLVLLGDRLDGTKEVIALARACASPPSRGPTCCATAAGAACVTPSWSSVTARWAVEGAGRGVPGCPASALLGPQRPEMSRTPCRSPLSRVQRR